MRPPDGMPRSVSPSGFPLRLRLSTSDAAQNNQQHSLNSMHPSPGGTTPSGAGTQGSPTYPRQNGASIPHQYMEMLQDYQDNSTTMPVHPLPMRPAAPAAQPSQSFANTSLQQQSQAHTFLQRIRELVLHQRTLVANLNQMLRALNMSTTGVKQQKQERLLMAAQQLMARGDFERLAVVLRAVELSVAPELRSSNLTPGGFISEQPRTTYTQQVNSLGQSPFVEMNSNGDAARAHNAAVRAYGRVLSMPSNGISPISSSAAASPPLRHSRMGGRAANGHAAHHASASSKLADFRAGALGAGPPTTPLKFRPSPFYTLDKMIHTPEYFLKPHTRVVQRTLVIRFPPEAQQDEAQRVLLVGQEYQPQATSPQPMYYPFYFDIELDGKPIKVNTRGVRGIPGSAKPVDLKAAVLERLGPQASQEQQQRALGKSHSLRLVAHIVDTGEVSSSKSFAFMVCLGQFTPLDELVSSLQARSHIPFDKTREMAAALSDDDIVADDAVYSLKDNVMMTRIGTPIRSTLCKHIDCFDAHSFMQLQSQAETWKCPICNIFMTWASLAVDDFFSQILKMAGPSISSVTIKSDGSWVLSAESDDDESSSDDDIPMPKRVREEIVEILSDDDDEPQAAPPARTAPSRPTQSPHPQPESPAGTRPGAPSPGPHAGPTESPGPQTESSGSRHPSQTESSRHSSQTESLGSRHSSLHTESPGPRQNGQTESPGPRHTPLQTESPGPRHTPLQTESPGLRHTPLQTESPGSRHTPLQTQSQVPYPGSMQSQPPGVQSPAGTHPLLQTHPATPGAPLQTQPTQQDPAAPVQPSQSLTQQDHAAPVQPGQPLTQQDHAAPPVQPPQPAPTPARIPESEISAALNAFQTSRSFIFFPEPDVVDLTSD